MPFIFLMLFALILMQPRWPGPPSWLTEEGCAVLVGTMVAASWLVAGLIAQTLAWQMIRQPELHSVLLRRYNRWRRNHFLGLLIAYLATLYWFGWGQVLEGVWKEAFARLFGVTSDGLLPGYQIGLLVPFFAALLLSWERFYYIEKIAYERGHAPDPFISKPAYLLLQIRHQLLLVLPPMVLLFLQQVLFAFIPDLDEDSTLAVAVGLMIFAGIFLLMPVFLRIFLGLKPLPAGPLRDRLEQAANLVHFRYSNILVWNTRSLVANALVTGFIPWIRYIVLTDRLIEELTPDEVEAVFAHEIGHIIHQHFLFYMAFFLTSFLLLGLCWDGAKTWLQEEEMLAAIKAWPDFSDDLEDTLRTYSSFGKLALLAAYTLLVFGFLSRRCERQADLFGSQVASTEVFINALEKVAAINGISRNRGSWQHPTIAQRVEFLEQMRDNPSLVPRFHRRLLLLRWSFFILLGVLLSFEWKHVYKLLTQF